MLRFTMMRGGLVTLALAFTATAGAAQNAPAVATPAAMPAPLAYGLSVGLDTAKKAAAAAVAEARRINVSMAVAVVDTGGHLVYLEKMDGTQTASPQIAIEKARSSVLFRRPTKSFQDTLAQGGLGWRFLGLPGVVPVDGGVPLVEGGKIIGAIGLSGGSSDQDGQCAVAGAAVVK